MPASRLATRGRIPTWLTESGILKPASPGPIHIPDCLHRCGLVPFRDDEGRMVVACPSDPPCFEGYLAVPEEDATFFTLDAQALVKRIAVVNGLQHPRKAIRAPEESWLLGIKEIRERQVFVFMTGMRFNASLLDAVANVLYRKGETDLLLLHAGRPDASTVEAAERLKVTLFPLPMDADWKLQLPWVDVADQINPSYMEGRASNNWFVYEDVELRLATEPGKRHIVIINGKECTGFAESDASFSRFLFLAANCKATTAPYSCGWVDRDDLLLDGRGHHIDALRKALSKGLGCGLPGEDLRALVRAHPENNGSFRLALLPANIIFDASLKDISPVQAALLKRTRTKSETIDSAKHRQDMQKSVVDARLLFKKSLQLIDLA